MHIFYFYWIGKSLSSITSLLADCNCFKKKAFCNAIVAIVSRMLIVHFPFDLNYLFYRNQSLQILLILLLIACCFFGLFNQEVFTIILFYCFIKRSILSLIFVIRFYFTWLTHFYFCLFLHLWIKFEVEIFVCRFFVSYL